MRVEVHTNGFEKTDSVETFLTDAASELVNEFLRNEGDAHIKVHVHEDRHRTQNRKPHFCCEIQLKAGGSRKWYKTHKAAEDFRTAAQEAFHAMKSILQRRSDRRHDLKVGKASFHQQPAESVETETEFESYEEIRS